MNFNQIPADVLAHIVSYDAYSNFPLVSKHCKQVTEIAAKKLFNRLKASEDCADIIWRVERTIKEPIHETGVGDVKQDLPIYLPRIKAIYHEVVKSVITWEGGVNQLLTKLVFIGDNRVFYPAVSRLPEVMHWLQEQEDEVMYPPFFEILAKQIPEFKDYMKSLESVKGYEKTHMLKEWLKENTSLLAQIKSLELNNLGFFPKEIEHFPNLEVLILNSNGFKDFPEGILKLKHLKHLDLKNNKIENLPNEIDSLIDLEFIALTNNELKHLPESIANLNNLKILYVSRNWLTSLPEKIGSLSKLTSLNVSRNRLTSLPQELKNLNQLMDLFINNNLLTTLPEEIADLNSLINIKIGENPFKFIPSKIVYSNARVFFHNPVIQKFKQKQTTLIPTQGFIKNLLGYFKNLDKT